MRRTVRQLADGREIIYFDAGRAAPARDAVDRRRLEPIAGASEIRHDALTGEAVVIASHRLGRTHLPSAADCPLCPSTPARATEIPEPDYEVAVFENRFPSFTGPGRCEVVCLTAQHATSFAALPAERVRLVVDAWADRTAELGALDGVEYVYPVREPRRGDRGLGEQPFPGADRGAAKAGGRGRVAAR